MFIVLVLPSENSHKASQKTFTKIVRIFLAGFHMPLHTLMQDRVILRGDAEK